MGLGCSSGLGDMINTLQGLGSTPSTKNLEHTGRVCLWVTSLQPVTQKAWDAFLVLSDRVT